ncbi:MAG: CoA-binding protein, partial [Candidatus Micrarchaeota archaeon]
MKDNMEKIFNPNSIAVIGASSKRHKIGNLIFTKLAKNYGARVYPVNTKRSIINGHKAYKSVRDLPAAPDHAVIVTPAQAVIPILNECAHMGVKAVTIITSGFSEVGNSGAEEGIRKIAKMYNMRIVGPNCLGIYDTYSGIDMLFLPEEKMSKLSRGKVSIISQSGAVGSAMLDWMASFGLGISKFVSYGNAADVDESDLIEYLSNDKSTEVICAYLEGTQDGAKFIQAAKQCKKPVIIIKAGKTEQGTNAVSSHTGKMAGANEVYNAAFEEAGIVRAGDMREMFDYAKAFLTQPRTNGKTVAIITNGGGFGVLATDAVVENGLEIAEFSPETKRELRKIIPSYGNIANPLDLLGDADASKYKEALKILDRDKNIDAFLCVTLFQTHNMEKEVADVVTSFNNQTKKPLVASSCGGDFVKRQVSRMEERGVPVYYTPE